MAWKKRVKVCMKCGQEFELETGAPLTRKFCYACSNFKKTLTCKNCGCGFVHFGRGRRDFCCACVRNKKSLSVMLRRARKSPSVRLGVGSGGNQKGESNHAWNPYSTYRGVPRKDNFEARSICAAMWPKECVMCRTTAKLHAHHINGNWKDNRPSNIVFLCNSCHMSLHHKLSKKDPQSLTEALFSLWPAGRSKIAEKIGNPEMWESEVKARNNGWASHNDYQVKPGQQLVFDF